MREAWATAGVLLLGIGVGAVNVDEQLGRIVEVLGLIVLLIRTYLEWRRGRA